MGLLSSAISGAANLAGAFIAKESQESAAEDIRDATNRAVNISAQGRQAAKGAISGGVDRQVEEIKAIGRGAYPGLLDPGQKVAMDDIIRQTQNSLAASPGLRGSGRAQSAIISDVVGRQRADFQQENQAKLDRVRETLGNIYAGEGRDVANVELGHAAQAGDAVVTGARASAPYDVSGAINLGQGVIDTAKTAGGALGAYLAQEEKAAASRRFGKTDI